MNSLIETLTNCQGGPAGVAGAQTAQQEKGEGERLGFSPPTLIDSTARQIPIDDEMPLARDGIPPQPQPSPPGN